MKIFFFLLFPLITIAQNDSIADKNISVISAKKWMLYTVVYIILFKLLYTSYSKL